MAGLAEVIEAVERGQAQTMTSVLWRAEVLDFSLSAVQIKRLKDAFDGVSVIELQIDGRIMDLAGEIRATQRSSTKKDALKNIRVPDAIHLASAIHFDATEFHTFDGAKVSGQTKGLLTLDGNVGGHRLHVRSPRAIQLRFPFGTTEDSADDVE